MSNDPPQNPRSRLIVPGTPDKPRTRLIAPAVSDEQEEGGNPEEDAEWPVSVAPLSPPPAVEQPVDEEPPIGEAEQGEFTVIDEDTGETHTVPVKVSSMSPPPVAVAEPDEIPDEEAEEAARQQAAYEEELAAYDAAQREAAAQQAAYVAELAAFEAQQQAAQHRVPQAGGYAPRPASAYGPLPVVMGGGVPGWALIMIGLLLGFVGSVLAYKFTDFGKMIRPDAKRPVEESSFLGNSDSGRML